MSIGRSPTKMTILALAILAVVLPDRLAAQGFSSCITFENLTYNDRYDVGQSFTSAGVTFTVQAFTFADGTVSTDGRAQVDNRQFAGGAGLDLNTRSVNVDLGFGGPVDGLSLRFWEETGNINLDLNGEFRSADSFAPLDGQSVGGVMVTVTPGTDPNTGVLTLDGTINSLALGGMELWIDDVCPAGVTESAKAHEVDFFMGGLFTEDDLPLNAGFNTGFRYGYELRSPFWLELETGIVFTGEVDTSGLLGHAQIQLRWHPFSPNRPADPFLLVGLGGATYYTIGASESSPLIVLGFGLHFYWLDNVGFRLDAGDFWLTDMVGESAHNFRVNWGPVFWF